MIAVPLITATIILHREGSLALPALSSMRDMVDCARHKGLAVEARAVLDRADELTRHMVAARGAWLDGIEEITVGDLGLARNTGVRSAHGQFLTFLDGDDLWGEDWLHNALRAATAPDAPVEAIWHPEFVYYFVESDYDRHSIQAEPRSDVQSYFMVHRPSDASEFNRDVLFLNNIWTANVFAPRTIHERYPYSAVDRERGVGVEDWSWHIETLWAGIAHRLAADTVHLIRVKEAHSLGQRNTVEGLLPHLPEDVRPCYTPNSTVGLEPEELTRAK